MKASTDNEEAASELTSLVVGAPISKTMVMARDLVMVDGRVTIPHREEMS